MRLSRTAMIATPLVFASGMCALVYQIVWTRELRFVFGASTAAAAAVVAIFIAGLGVGGLVLGKRVERSAEPLKFYAHLELGIACASALTPVLLWLARATYIALGGSLALGVGGATAVRLLLSLLVLGAPTFLMGGTLPAVARAVETEDDGARRGVAIAYGANTLGAVVGCLLADFVLLEALGSRRALLAACAVNVLVGLVARAIARTVTFTSASVNAGASTSTSASMPASAPASDMGRWMVLVSAGVVGFAFFLMELVWYRLLGPLLGGTVFAFGLILAVALAGIGAGSAFYTWFPIRSRAASFALTCLLEALLIAVPFALGDRIALLALMLRPLGGLGFAGLAFGWVLVCSLVVLPAAFVSGAQFPLLIALLGRGRENVGREVGQTYAANTLGAIAGALAGGFGLLPALGALGCYRFAAGLLLGWGVVVALLALRGEVARLQLTAAAAIALASVLLLSAQGPTAAFRHSPIGAGRVDPSQVDSPNAARAFLRRERQGIVWQAEGVESVVALEGTAGLAFVVNGKIDGNARADAGTQVMLGLVGAPLVPQVKTALVVGLGTGSSAGWLAKLPGIERVDVAEIEPAIVEVAKRCAAVNESVSDNPKVHVFRGDARELLAVSRTQYDLIVSEPSNPYRAGIASLYTQDFYERVAMRLSPHGLFVQWVQSYEIDAGTVRTIYATLDSVFPFVETYRGMPRDLFLIGSRERPVHDAATLRARVEAEPMARALRVAWRTQGVEGYLAHFVAGAGFAKAVAQHHHGGLSTDDLSPIEFAFGRYLGRELAFSVGAVLKAARTLKQARPEVTGDVDWARVDLEREVFAQTHGQKGDPRALQDADRPRFAVMALWSEGRLQEAFDAWQRLPESVRAAPITAERVAWAEAQVNGGGSEAEARMQELAQQQPTEAAALRAAWFLKQGKAGDAANAFADAFTRYRNDPWPSPELMERALRNLQTLGTADRKLAPQLDTLLQKPFSVRVNDQNRQEARMALALALGPSNPLCVSAYAEQEPNVSWTAAALGFRAACYAAQSSPLRARAEEDLAEYDATAPPSFADLVH